VNWVIARNCAATNNLSARPVLASLFSAIRRTAQAGWLPISTDCVFDASLLRVAASTHGAARLEGQYYAVLTPGRNLTSRTVASFFRCA
jgi:hypothetical protein